jgi:hypothetical protein
MRPEYIHQMIGLALKIIGSQLLMAEIPVNLAPKSKGGQLFALPECFRIGMPV